MSKLSGLRFAKMARIPRVENFLFCYPLRSGILFIATVPVVFHVVQLLVLAFMYDVIQTTLDRIPYEEHGHHTVRTGHHTVRTQGFAYGAAQTLGSGLVIITLNVLLIIGVLYKKPNFFLPWLAVSGIAQVGLVLALFAITVFFPIYLPGLPAMTAGAFFLVLIVEGCLFHIFCVVHTYYRQLMEPQETDMKLLPRDPVKIPYSNVENVETN